MKKICIIFGGNTIESEYSIKAGNVLFNELKSHFHILLIRVEDLLGNKSIVNSLKEADCVINLVYGTPGQEGLVPIICETLDIPYLGADQFSSCLVKDKYIAKTIALKNGIKTPEFMYYDIKNSDVTAINYPVVVKPAQRGGLSLGITYCENQSEIISAINIARMYDSHLIIEKFIEGREFSICAIEYENNLLVLPPIEIIKKNRICDFEAKTSGTRKLTVNPLLPPRIYHTFSETVRTLFQAFSLKDYAYFDFILQNDDLYFIEAGAVPGFTRNSNLPVSLKSRGIDLVSFISDRVEYRINNAT